MKPGDSVVITSGALRGVPGRVRRISPRTSWATVELLQPAGAYDAGDTVNVPQYELKQTAGGIVIPDIGVGPVSSTGWGGV